MPTWTPQRSTLIDLGGRSLREVGEQSASTEQVSVEARPSGLLLASSKANPSGSVGGDWGDGAAWQSRPVQATNIIISGSSGVTIDNLYFDGTAYSNYVYDSGASSNAHVCIRILNSSNITIENCDFFQVSEPIEVYNSSNVEVRYNRCHGILGPGERVNEQTGNFLQTHPGGGCDYVWVHHNKIIAMGPGPWDPWSGAHELGPEDVISFFGASNCTAEYNEIDATGYERAFGTGTILGDGGGSDNLIQYNTYLNPGQVGIAVAGFYRNHLIGNIIYREAGQVTGSGNTAAYYWGYNGNPIGDGLIQDNRAKWYGGGGLWNPGGAVLVNNNWDDNSIDPNDLEVVL